MVKLGSICGLNVIGAAVQQTVAGDVIVSKQNGSVYFIATPFP
jgi:hypothetical protein